MKVRATEECFFRNVRRHTGEEFEFKGTKKELPEWVEVVEEDRPKRRKTQETGDTGDDGGEE